MSTLLSTAATSLFGGNATTAPTPQKASERPIAFVLTVDGGTPIRVDLLIRPEDLQWTEPSRLAVVQTLGGAWADSFGPGVQTISISGHTGWRTTTAAGDWELRFNRLQHAVFRGWHEAIKDLKDPSKVVLEFVDVLDGRAVEVVPNTFVLKRNKARPLLMQYNISITVIRDSSQSVAPIPDAAQSAILSGLRTAAKAAATAAAVARMLLDDPASYGIYKALEISFLAANTALVAAAVLEDFI